MSNYRELPPPSVLARHVVCVWTRSTGDDGSDDAPRVVPDGCADIVWMDDSAPVVVGPATLPVLVTLPPHTSIVGVRFRSGMAPGPLGLPANELLDARVPLRDVWGRDAASLEDRAATNEAKLAALEAALVSRLARAEPHDALVLAAVDRLSKRSTNRVDELSRLLGISNRQLLRRFSAAVGYGPKTFWRIARFQRLLRLARTTPAEQLSLAQLAGDAGYADQAHMTREVTSLAGVPPTTLLSEAGGTMGARFSRDRAVWHAYPM
jgi:AraC-like DNA-binding protein